MYLFKKGLSGTELSLHIDQQKGYFIAGIYFMLSKGENTLNKLKPDFIGFSFPSRGNYFAGVMQESEDNVITRPDVLFSRR